MLGVFMSLDLLLFFVFWEIGLVPMYFLINQWGSANRRLRLVQVLHLHHGRLARAAAGDPVHRPGVGHVRPGGDHRDVGRRSWPLTLLRPAAQLPIATVKAIAFWAFVIAFAIKVPIWPFHTWLPDAHTEAPTAGSMILAGVLLKLGAYGFLRLVLPLFPEQAQAYAGVLALLAVAGDRLRRVRLLGAERLQAAGGLLIGQPHGLRRAGHRRRGLAQGTMPARRCA